MNPHDIVTREQDEAFKETNMSEETKFDQWAIVDVMGHQRFIGRVSEQVVAGQGFIRVDVPKTNGSPAWTKLLGASSIYAITPVSEEIALATPKRSRARPVEAYHLPTDMQPRLSFEREDDEME